MKKLTALEKRNLKDRELQQLIEDNNLFATTLHLKQVCKVAMERAQQLTGAKTASIMLYDSKEMVLKVACETEERDDEVDSDEGFPVLGSIWEKVVIDSVPLLVENVAGFGNLGVAAYGNLDFQSFATGSFLSVPLKIAKEVVGVLNVGGKRVGVFTEDDKKQLSFLAFPCASSVKKAILSQASEREIKKRLIFQRCLSPRVVDEIMGNRQDVMLGGEVAECSVLFANICDFSSLAEKESPETVIYLLNEYFSLMTEIIFRYNGTLDKFIGDTLMAFFGAPIFSPTAHRDAVSAALEMQQAMRRLKVVWDLEDFPTFDHKIGINTGSVIAGNIGGPYRMDYTVIGGVVTDAALIESKASPMTTLISETTYQKAKESINVKAGMPIELKGKQVKTYEVLSIKQIGGDPDSIRNFARSQVAISLTIAGKDDDSDACEGTVINVSTGGALLSLMDVVEVGENIWLNLPLGEPSNIISIKGRAIYRKKLRDAIGNEYFHTGVEFDDSSRESVDRLHDFLKS